MEKKLNLLGIRKKVILYHIKSLVGITYTVMRPITEEDEKNIDKLEYLDIDNRHIDKKDIYCYGEINLSSDDDIQYLKSLTYLILIMVELFIVILIIKKVMQLLKQ